MTIIGFGFKIAAVPLISDRMYQGAPTPSAALIASKPKWKLFHLASDGIRFAGAEGSGGWRSFLAGWMPLLAVCAALSVVLGNLAAIVKQV
jgi:NADH:ubiquinone oxidoreductase subunit 2 (subunit N)